ncbi:MAG TPA: aspartate kinase [bacterium]|nr:aspartate kinase [bacterium]
MSKIVVKIGGSNLKDTASLHKVINTIKKYNQPLVVVVSAFYGITDRLVEILTLVKHDRDEIQELTNFLLEMKQEVLEKQIDDKEILETTYQKLEQRVEELERYLLGIHYIGEAPGFVEDVVLSYGERLSALVMTAILRAHNIDAEEALPEQIGLETNGQFGRATVNFEKSRQDLMKNLGGDKIYIVPGFYGISSDKKVTLLGRGGSDYSAASIARCINAKSLDVWKDVDGFLTADPGLVKQARRVKRLSYTEAAELAYFGAKILHPLTISPLMNTNIPVRIFNINNDIDLENPFSVIDSSTKVSSQIIKSVTYNDDFAILKLIGPGVGIRPGLLADVTTKLGSYNINIKSVITSQTSINLLLARKDLLKAYNIVQELDLQLVNELQTVDDISVIALIGEGMMEKCGLAARMFGAMSQENINILIISEGASPVTAYFIIHQDERDKAVRAIHREFFENDSEN